MKKILFLLVFVLLLSGCGYKSALPSPTKSPASTTKSSFSSSVSVYGYDRESTWGELFDRYGVVYDTLTSYQKSLINYPKLNTSCVYYVKSGKSYHSVKWCYTLSRSKEILSSSYSSARSRGLSPCSKCVDPKQIP